MEIQLLWNFVLALMLGAIIGLERDIRDTEDEKYIQNNINTGSIGGIRFYALIALGGAITAWMDQIFSMEMWKMA